MRKTPAQQHLMRKLAAQAATQSSPHGEVLGDAYQLMLAQLTEHRRSLKDIQSVERKIEFKRQILPEYDAWVDGVLSADAGGQDMIVATVTVWQIDVGHFARALELGSYAIKHGLDMPDQYERSLPVVLIDEFSDAALAGKMAIEDAQVLLPQVLSLTASFDAPDEARAKLHKAIGYALIGRLGRQEAVVDELPLEVVTPALAQLTRALELCQQIGVKKDVERLERRLRKLSEAPAS